MEFENVPATPENIEQLPKLYLSTQQLADRWGFSPNAVSTWRKRNKGPKFLKKGYRSIVYLLSDIEQFERENPGFRLN